MHPIKFFSESDSVTQVLRDQSPNQHDPTNILVNIVSNVVEWRKWDLDTILNTPFTPMMLIVNSVLKQRDKGAPTNQPASTNQQSPTTVGHKDFTSPQFLQDILKNPDKY